MAIPLTAARLFALTYHIHTAQYAHAIEQNVFVPYDDNQWAELVRDVAVPCADAAIGLCRENPTGNDTHNWLSHRQ